MSDVTDRFHRIQPMAKAPVWPAALCTGLRAVAAAWLIPAVLMVSGLLSSLAAAKSDSSMSEFVVPSGPTIVLQDGEAIDGHIVKLDQTNVTIQTVDGAQVIVPRSTIEAIRFGTVAGNTIEGALIGWQPGIYELTTTESVVTVYSTMAMPLAEESNVAGDTSEPGNSDEPIDDETIVAAHDGTNGTTSADTAEGETDNPVDQVAATAPATDLEISVSVANARENGAPIAFNIELSRPADTSVVLIYATIDGTAVNGEDYEPMRGVMVIKAGETSAKIEASVINDDVAEEVENLQLFLTVDPTVAVVKNREIVATIEDDDQG